MDRLFFLLFLVGLSCQWPQLRVKQFVNVTGRLTCHGKPAAKVRVVLGERDWPDKNDILQETETDDDGIFELAGNETETFTIQPFIAIAHFCQTLTTSQDSTCLRAVYLNLPETIVSKGALANQSKMADIRLEMARDSEKIYCEKNSTQFSPPDEFSFVLSR